MVAEIKIIVYGLTHADCRWTPAAIGGTMSDIIAPASGEKISSVITDSTEFLDRTVETAHTRQKEWAELSFSHRKNMLLKMRTFIIERADELADAISECTGKTMNDALATEVQPCTLAIGYYLKCFQKLQKPRHLGRSSIIFFNKKSILIHEPWGVIGIISPWNYPFGIPFHEVFSALAAGNAVVLKVATQAQPVGEYFKQMAAYAGLPEGLLSVVHLRGKVSGKAFLNSGIDKLFFTGSVAIGQELMQLAAEKLIPVSLELGGNDAMIVCSDANLYRAAAGAVWGGLSNCGQSCGGVERVYVMAEIYDQFMTELTAIVTRLRQGRGYDVDIGSMTTRKQKQTVEAHIKDALEKGAQIAASSPEVEGNLYHPAVVLTHVTHEMDVMRHETFGPLLAVCKVNTEQQAVEMANDAYLGLTASIWTKDRKKANALARQLQAGTVTINDHLMSHGMAETPWGGYKMSSIGRSHGGPGLHEMVQSKVIVDDLAHQLPRNIWWQPYSLRQYKALKAVGNAFYGKGVWMRIKSIAALSGFYLKQMRR